MAKQNPNSQKELHASANYFEPLFRARFVRAMKQLQKDTSINHLAMSMGNSRQAKELIPRSAIIKALAPLRKVLRDSFIRGGKVGAEHVKDVLNG